MRRQKCAQCGTMLDITKLESGSKFACASCGAILVVGEATAVKKSFKESGPAFTPKGKAEASAPAPAPARRERAERPSRRGGEGEPARKSRLPIFLGAGVIAVGAIVAIVLSTGSGGGAGGQKGPTAAEWWASKNVANANAEDLRNWLAEGRSRGYDKDPAFWADKEGQLQAALLRKDPSDATANERAGNRNLRDYPDFDKVYARLQESYKRLPRELQEFADSLEVPEGKPVWMPPAKYDAASAKLDEFAAWQKKADENPAAGAIEAFTRQAKNLLSTSQRKLGFGAVAEGPFVVLASYPDEGGDPALTAAVAEGRKWANGLKVVKEEFDRRIREPLGLAPVEAGKYYCSVIVPTDEDLRKIIGQGGGLDATGDIPAYFSPTTKWSHLKEPKEPAEKAVFGGDVAHEAVHQLHYHYSMDPRDKFENLMARWSGIWLTEGLAEYLGGGVEVDPASGKATFTGNPPRRVQFLREMRDNGVPLIPLRDLVQFRPDNYAAHVGEWRARMRDNEEMPEAALQWIDTQHGWTSKVVYAQSWLLFHFLYEAEGGKHRAKLMDLVLTAFRGGQKPERYRKDASVAEKFGSADEAFAEILGLKDEALWKELQAAHDNHARSLRGD